MALDQTSATSILKTLYPSEVVKNLVYKNNPFFAMIPKDESFFGDSSKEPIIIGTPQNRSSSFSDANVSTTNSIAKHFLLTRKSNYSMATIANETLESTKSDKGAFISALQFEIDQALLALTRSLAAQMYRSGTGTVARLSASATVNSASTPVALEIADQATQLEVGMKIALSATDGGAARAGTAYIVSIDRAAGSFLCSATFGGSAAALDSLITSPAASDYVYQAAGDRNAVISGLGAWLKGTDVANSGDSFFGLDRATDKVRLAGIKVDASATTIEAGLVQAATLIGREGGAPDTVLISYRDWARLVAELGAKVQYTTVNVAEASVNVSFTSLMLNSPTGVLKVIADANCPAGTAFVLTMSTWKLKSLGEAVRLFNADGLTTIRAASADAVEIRAFSYSQMSCRAPGHNARVILPA